MKNALILSTGGSPEPLIYCIKNFDPDLVYFLPSEKTKNDIPNIINQSGFSKEFRKEIISDSENLQNSFTTSLKVIKELQNEGFNVSIDFTGGTKPMVGGLLLAAIGEGCKYSYVGAKEDGRDKNGVGAVQSGFEDIKEQKDPYDTFAIIDFDRGMRFFNKYQFKAAKDNFINAESKLEDPLLKSKANFYIKLVKFYDRWDRFNNEIFKKTKLNYYLGKLIDDLQNDNNLFNNIKNENSDFLNQLNANKKFLDKKISNRDKNIEENINYYLPDLLNNAKRRIEERKFDDAVARLYRAVELIAQTNLNKLGVIDVSKLKDNKVFHINENQLTECFSNFKNINPEEKLNEFIIKDYNYDSSKGTFKLASKNSYILLSELEVELAKVYLADGNIKSAVNKRNDSILAHGLDPVSDNDANDLFDLTFEYSEMLCSGIENYMKMAEFPKFKE